MLGRGNRPRKSIGGGGAIKGQHSKYVSRLATNLKDLRFRAIENSLEQKEIQRLAHDNHRSSHAAANAMSQVKRGSIVCVHQPTPGLRKLRYQWSEPVFLVLAVTPQVVRAISLVSKEGARGCFPPTININRKMLEPYPITPSFFVGAQIMRKFKQGIFAGTITEVMDDEGGVFVACGVRGL